MAACMCTLCSWALVKNEANPHLSLPGLFPMPFHSITYVYGKAWGRDLERNRWSWPHSLQVPVVVSLAVRNCDHETE